MLFGINLGVVEKSGISALFLLSAHGDPYHIEALENIDPLSVKVLELYEFDMPNILEKQKGAKHAGEVETSVMLFLYPEKVRKKDIKDFEMSFEDFKPYLMHEKIETIENSPGCQGYPSFASVEKGKVLFSLMKRHALNWILREIL